MAEWTITSASNTNDIIWHDWCDSTSASSATSDVIWAGWTSADSGSIIYSSPKTLQNLDQYRETEEQQQARLEHERQAQLEREQRRETARLEREEAQRKAQELLRESLDKEQQEQLEKTKWFFVIGQSGKRYRIRDGWSGNVDELNEEDRIVATYCIHPQRHVPVEDSMLIQKLMLEADEPCFLQIANKTTLHEPLFAAV